MRPLHVPSTSSRYRQNPFAIQWGVVYAAGAWGLLQGLEYVTETFH
jgi:hypothetical protein